MRLKDESGFSLLEILIAMALLAIMMTSIVTITSTGIDTKDKVLAEDNEFTQVETALNRISDDFYQIYSPIYYSNAEKGPKRSDNEEEGFPKIKFTPSEKFPSISDKGQPIPATLSPDKQTLIFFSTANRRKMKNSKESNFAWIKYSLRTTEGEKNPEAPYELVRYVDTKNVFDSNFKFDDLKPSVMLKNIKSMEISYWDKGKKKFEDSLRYLNQDSLALAGIQIELTWINKNKNEKTIKRILIPEWQAPKPPADDNNQANSPQEEFSSEDKPEE